METLIKVPEKVKENRRKHHPHIDNNIANETPKNDFVLNQNDYDDFIKIKRQRRKNYYEQSTMYFFIGLAISLFLVSTAFNWRFYDNGSNITLLTDESTSFEEIQDIPLTEQPPPPPPSVIQLPTIVEVPDEVILEEVDIDMDVEITEETVIEEVIFDTIEEEEVADEIFYIVENQPVPIGGYDAFYEFVSKNMNYPRSAIRLRIQGRVYVQFVVGKNGEISNAKVIKGIDKACDDEALRVINSAPKWKPGKQRGNPVMVYMSLPITFKLGN